MSDYRSARISESKCIVYMCWWLRNLCGRRASLGCVVVLYILAPFILHSLRPYCPYLRFAILSLLLLLRLSFSPFSDPFVGRPVSEGGVLGHIQQWANAKLSKHEARTNGSCVFCLCVARSLPHECVFTLKRSFDLFSPLFEWINNGRPVNESGIVFEWPALQGECTVIIITFIYFE